MTVHMEYLLTWQDTWIRVAKSLGTSLIRCFFLKSTSANRTQVPRVEGLGNPRSHKVDLVVEPAETVLRADVGAAESAESVVQELYEALEERNVARLKTLIVMDLEWSFHGPPSERHLERMLTGANDLGTFHFEPQRVFVVGNKVLVEGHERGVWWVHAWTVKGGIVTQLQEYFNTNVTVMSMAPCDKCFEFLGQFPYCVTLWHSKLSEANGKSLPGLVLAI